MGNETTHMVYSTVSWSRRFTLFHNDIHLSALTTPMKTSQLLDKWERKGIITAEQKEAMKADLVMASKESRSNKFTVIVSVL